MLAVHSRRFLSSMILFTMVPLLAAKGPSTPHFKWAQNRNQIFLSIMVRDLDSASVALSLPSPDKVVFRAKNTKGEEYALDLALREEVIMKENFKWSIETRPFKWGTSTFCVLNKVIQHKWDVLVTAPSKYKGLMEKDWSREDRTLESDDEIPYVEDNSEYLVALTSENIEETRKKFSTLVVNVRYPWCETCKVADNSYVEAAKAVEKKGEKDAKWKNIGFAVLDAREERKLGKELGAQCDLDTTKRYAKCEYRVYTGGEDEAVVLRATKEGAQLLTPLAMFLEPAVQVLKDVGEAGPLRQDSTTIVGKFAGENDPEFAVFKKVAGLMRGQAAFAAVFGEAAPPELWPHKEDSSMTFDGSLLDDGTAFQNWVKPRNLPLLQEHDDDDWQQAELPVAKVYIDDDFSDPSEEKIRDSVRRVAKRFVGKIVFVEMTKSTAFNGDEFREYGINNAQDFPAFAIASNSSESSAKYLFESAESVLALWNDADKTVEKLTNFCEQVLAGAWPQAHKSAEVQKDWKKGTPKQLVWKTYNEITSPEKPLLLEVYSDYRLSNERKRQEVEHLAAALSGVDSFTVARYETTENYLPPGDFHREPRSIATEWYWVPAKAAGSKRPAMKKLTKKPQKDTPMKEVMKFAAKRAGNFKVKDVMPMFEKRMVAAGASVSPQDLDDAEF